MNNFISKAMPNGDCLIWIAARNKEGYGRFQYQGKLWMAHRLAWTIKFGKIPDGLHVLHKCDNPPCINTDHLFLGSNADNILDKVSKGRQARNFKTHCKNGHEYTEENTFVRKQGWKECRICIRQNQKAARKRKRIAA